VDTFAPPVEPTIQSNTTFTSNVAQANFGDGYEQTATIGLNPVSGTYTAQWDILSVSDRDTIEAFFTTHKGAQAFLFTFPSESTPRKFKCKTWTRGSNGALFTLQAELREVFDIA
jgi:phage-related protein